LEKFAACELHRFSHTVDDLAVEDMFIVASGAKVFSGGSKVPAVVQLVMHGLGERCTGYNWESVVRYILAEKGMGK
jgi:hypothetical protein